MKTFDTGGSSIPKEATGIPGLDLATVGGIPRGRITLIQGNAGAGKTVLSLQSLVHAARVLAEPCIFVAFEEPAARLVANCADFGWDVPALDGSSLHFIAAQPPVDSMTLGDFDLNGLLTALEFKVEATGARRIVFDSIDIVLATLEPIAEQRELRRLHEWLSARELTSIITAKDDGESFARHMQFMVDCTMVLRHRTVGGVSQRSLQIGKYRGSDFHENEMPYVITSTGMEVASVGQLLPVAAVVSQERMTTGVTDVDEMLGGGIFRGASVLLTGSPGTAKTSLAGAFAEAACRRGERTLFVSFDSSAQEVVRNLGSVGVELGPHLGEGGSGGPLQMLHLRAIYGSAEKHGLEIQSVARRMGATCVVIDPMSALSAQGNDGVAHSVAERIIAWTKAEGITTLLTSLLESDRPEAEGSPLQISTIADTWIHLSYLVRGGERNRALTIVKSRGTRHSNQVRELLLSGDGMTLARPYFAAGEVLMGTLRLEREQHEAARRAQSEIDSAERRSHLQAEVASLTARVLEVERELLAKQSQIEILDRREEVREELLESARTGRDNSRAGRV